MKLSNKITTALFLIFIFGGFVLNAIAPSKGFSEEENRYLEQKPKFSFADLKSGEYTSKFEKYVTDQIVFRNFWVGFKSDMESLRGMKENNSVFAGKDGHLLGKFVKPNGELLNTNINSINSFKDNNNDIPVSLMVVPTATEILQEKLPYGAPTFDQKAIIDYIKNNINSDVNFVDAYDELLSHNEEEIYYKTDHHWTSLGAYYGYVAASKTLGFKALDIDDFNREVLSESFYGTTYSKFNNKRIEPDKVEAFYPKQGVEHRLHYVDEQEEHEGLYRKEFLEKKDKYSVFLGGNHSEVEIKNKISQGEKKDKKLLVIKDSYAHSMMPFLANHYKEIDMLDLRYYKKNINEYIKENHIDEVLVLYNADNFTTETSIKRLSK